MQVFLIRHPRPLIEAGVCYGRLDVDAEAVPAVAARLRELLPAGVPVISSPLRRARRLAEALHAEPRLDARLAEMDFGEWEGRRCADSERAQLDAWAADVLHFTPPGGESAAMLQARVLACAASYAGERLALVAHSGVMRVLLGHWLGLPVGEWSTLQLEFGSATLVELDDPRGKGQATLRFMSR